MVPRRVGGDARPAAFDHGQGREQGRRRGSVYAGANERPPLTRREGRQEIPAVFPNEASKGCDPGVDFTGFDEWGATVDLMKKLEHGAFAEAVQPPGQVAEALER